MKCQYCNKTVSSDKMPDHLSKNIKCHEQHGKQLRKQMNLILKQHEDSLKQYQEECDHDVVPIASHEVNVDVCRKCGKEWIY